MISVAIFGGGIAGLSAAHELAKFYDPAHPAEFKVTVYEAQSQVGGKASSQPAVMGDPNPPRQDLLGEHGFRFFPGFYRYLTRAMEEIVHPDGGSVLDQLVESDETGIAYPGEPLIVLPRRPTRNYAFDLYQMLVDVTGNGELMGFPSADLARAALKRLKFITSCTERREAFYEAQTWLEYLDETKLSQGYKDFEAALNRTLSAMGPEDTNAKVVGEIGMQFILGSLRPDERKDALLNAPTRYAWLEPWLDHLQNHGVTFDFHKLQSFTTQTVGGITTITGATVEDVGVVTAEHYICAIPLDSAQKVLLNSPDIVANFPIPAFQGAGDIQPMQEWMVGAQIYLSEDLPLCRGHFFLPESPWALSGVSQAQFWRRDRANGELEDLYGDGAIKGVLSIAISDWNTPDNDPVEPKRARDCLDSNEVLTRMLKQLGEGLNISFEAPLLVSVRLDSNITEDLGMPVGQRFTNTSPLLVHPPNSQRLRPKAFSDKVPNLLLASDYVQTFTQLATMEGANEAARAAVIRILSLKGLRYDSLVPEPLYEEEIFDLAKEIDRKRFVAGEKHLLDTWPFTEFGDGALGFEIIDTAMKMLGLVSPYLP